MPLVPAKCTNCGANISVDDSNDAAICEYCGTAFITEKAINNYHVTNNVNISNATFNVAGVSVNNLILRAEQFERQGDYKKADEYYNRALDIDAENQNALDGLKRLYAFYFGKSPVTKEQFEQVCYYINTGDRLSAIKLIRASSGLSFKDAMELADCFDTINFREPQESIPNSGRNIRKGECYVATAIYGSYDCPQVWTLRRYRDNTMAETWYGRTFIHTYYAISPTLVKWFGKTKWFLGLWKPVLDRIVKKLNESGVENTPYHDREW